MFYLPLFTVSPPEGNDSQHSESSSVRRGLHLSGVSESERSAGVYRRVFIQFQCITGSVRIYGVRLSAIYDDVSVQISRERVRQEGRGEENRKDGMKFNVR